MHNYLKIEKLIVLFSGEGRFFFLKFQKLDTFVHFELKLAKSIKNQNFAA